MCNKVGDLVKTTNAADAVAFNGGGASNSPVRWAGTESGMPKFGPVRAATVHAANIDYPKVNSPNDLRSLSIKWP